LCKILCFDCVTGLGDYPFQVESIFTDQTGGLCEVNSVKSFSMIIFNMAVRHKMANRHNYNIAKNVALVKGGIAVNLPLTSKNVFCYQIRPSYMMVVL
jgi:hypothetical protein